jgi:tetratricopeptide (TPR) repeat protein
VRRAPTHFRKAEAFLAKLPESESHAAFYLRLGTFFSNMLRIGDGLAAAKRAMEISERLHPDDWWSVAASLTSTLLNRSGSVTEALQLANQARRRADPIAKTITGSPVAVAGARIYLLLADPREAQEWSTHELAKPSTARSAIRSGRLLQHVLASACTAMGRLTEARAYLAEANAEKGVRSSLGKGGFLFFEGQWELAEKALTARATLQPKGSERASA